MVWFSEPCTIAPCGGVFVRGCVSSAVLVCFGMGMEDGIHVVNPVPEVSTALALSGLKLRGAKA